MKYPSIGSISHGTLRTEDLLSAFADALEDCVQHNAEMWCSDEGRATRDEMLTAVAEARELDPESKEAGEMLADLEVLLDQFAPPYTYFGVHEYDGADFGFWPTRSSIEEDRHCGELASGDELPCACCADTDLFLVVNERGNMTMYQRAEYNVTQAVDAEGNVLNDGRISGPDRIKAYEWVEVWSVV